jgi:hypothetical protein
MLKKIKGVLFAVATGASAIAIPSFAAEADYTALTAGVVVTNLIAALFAVAVVLVAMYLARRGIQLVMGMIKGG